MVNRKLLCEKHISKCNAKNSINMHPALVIACKSSEKRKCPKGGVEWEGVRELNGFTRVYSKQEVEGLIYRGGLHRMNCSKQGGKIFWTLFLQYLSNNYILWNNFPKKLFDEANEVSEENFWQFYIIYDNIVYTGLDSRSSTGRHRDHVWNKEVENKSRFFVYRFYNIYKKNWNVPSLQHIIL